MENVLPVPVLTQWVANAAIVLFFPLAFNRVGKPVAFAFLAAMCAAQAIFTIFFVPETRNKPLEEIEEYWKVKAGDFEDIRQGEARP